MKRSVGWWLEWGVCKAIDRPAWLIAVVLFYVSLPVLWILERRELKREIRDNPRRISEGLDHDHV